MFDNKVKEAAAEYLAAGWHLVAIPQGQKGPTSVGWNTAGGGVTDPASLPAGVGLAHAYSRTAALDFDDLAAAASWLAAKGVDVPALWSACDAVRISSGRTNRGKLLYRLPDGIAPLPTKKITDDAKRTLFELRCATANGLTVQDVLPPSIHPDTGKPYAWEYADDLIGHWSSLPTLPAPVLALWRALTERKPESPQEQTRLGLSAGQIRGALAHVDPSCGYDEWIKAGMAVHHESGGQPYGLDLFDTWSAASDKYPGRDAIEAKWDSFGRDRQSMVTGRWLMAQAKVASPEDFEDLSAPDPNAGPRFAFEPADLVADRPLPGWIVKGVLPDAGLAVIFGDSGSGKTFFVLDLAAAISRGVPWRDRKTTQGRVAYLCAEGATGFRKRLRAYRQHNGAALVEFFVHEGAPNLLLPADVTALIASLKALGPLRVVVVDTAARTMPGGNENTSEDMGRLIAAAGKIHEATGALVIFVHHSGKDASKGARGWSGLRAAADAQIEIIRDEDVRTIILDKQKDDADKGRLGFELHIVEIGTDADGDPITSCVLRECAPADPKGPGRPGGGTEGKTQAQAAFEAVRVALEMNDNPLTGTEAKALIAAVEPFASMDSVNRLSRVNRALTDAVAKGWLRSDAGIVSRN